MPERFCPHTDAFRYSERAEAVVPGCRRSLADVLFDNWYAIVHPRTGEPIPQTEALAIAVAHAESAFLTCLYAMSANAMPPAHERAVDVWCLQQQVEQAISRINLAKGA